MRVDRYVWWVNILFITVAGLLTAIAVGSSFFLIGPTVVQIAPYAICLGSVFLVGGCYRAAVNAPARTIRRDIRLLAERSEFGIAALRNAADAVAHARARAEWLAEVHGPDSPEATEAYRAADDWTVCARLELIMADQEVTAMKTAIEQSQADYTAACQRFLHRGRLLRDSR